MLNNWSGSLHPLDSSG